jgi:hypothetical protein
LCVQADLSFQLLVHDRLLCLNPTGLLCDLGLYARDALVNQLCAAPWTVSETFFRRLYALT